MLKLPTNKVAIPDRIEPFIYNTRTDLRPLNIDDIVDVTFGVKSFRVKKEYVNKTLRFKIVNLEEYSWWSTKYKILALVPIEKVEKFTKNDILFITTYGRFDSLMEDLFPCNRRPYAGWKNKEVKIEKIQDN